HSHSNISNGWPYLKKKEGAFDRYVDVLFLREESRRGSSVLSSPLGHLEVAKRREEIRYVDVTCLVGLVRSRPFSYKTTAIHSRYRFMSDVVGFVTSRLSLLHCFLKSKFWFSIPLKLWKA
ncbi:MAG: hypothetical protein PV344_03935, partial [Anaplasma sp.]|nr:hypothetical protein [Anaplasma sp.]